MVTRILSLLTQWIDTPAAAPFGVPVPFFRMSLPSSPAGRQAMFGAP